MEALDTKRENLQKRKNGFEFLSGNGVATESLVDSSVESRQSSSSGSSSELSSEDANAKAKSSVSPLGWPIRKAELCKSSAAKVGEDEQNTHADDSKFSNMDSKISGSLLSFL